MAILDATRAAGAAADQKNEDGARTPAGRESMTAPADPWSSLMTLNAIIAVWPDLSLSVRRRIASDAVDAMNWAEPGDGPPRRRAAATRH